MDLKRHPEAQREIDEAIVWYEAAVPGLGRRFFEAIIATATRVRSAPHGFPRWRRSAVRFAVVPDFPYTLFFRAEGSDVVVYAVAHQKRRPGYWRKRLSRG